MEKIRECPECGGYFQDEEFCSDCGSKIIERDPEVWISVEVERNENENLPTTHSELIDIEDLFNLAKKKGLIK